MPQLCGVSGRNRLGDLGDLLASADDSLSVLVTDIIVVLLVGPLPDLDLTTTTDDTDPHGREQVVCGVGVVVDTAVEHGSGILPDTRVDHGLATGVILDEVGDIVDDTGDRDQTTAVLGLFDVLVPLHDGKLVERSTPVQPGALLVDLLLQLLQTTLLDLVGTELLQVVGETELLPDPDRPLGGVILVPFDGVAVVGGELVVEVVVALAESDQSGDNVVTGRVAVIEGLVSEPVGEGVDAEGGLLDEEDTQDAGVDETTEPVTPAETSNQHGNDETHGEDDLEVVAVLPDDDGVLVQVGNVGAADPLRVLLHDHPAQVGVEETLADGVGILVGIGVAVVSTVVASPPADRTLDGTTTDGGQPDSQGQSGGIGSVSPETVVSYGNEMLAAASSAFCDRVQRQRTSCDSETGEVVVDDGPDGGLELQGHPDGLDASVQRDSDDEEDIEPVDMLVPVLARHGRIGDMDLLGLSGPRPRSLRGFGRHAEGLLLSITFLRSKIGEPAEVYRRRRREVMG